MSRRYRYCGLTLESQYPLPELDVIGDETQCDIHIRETRLGPIPSDLQTYGPNWAVGPREGWWWLNDRLVFRVRPGIIDIDPGTTEASLVRALLLEGPMVMAMIFIDCFCLNAASVRHSGETIVFCGAAGIGRSTAAARLAVQGGRIISDSLARIDVSEGKVAKISPQGSGTLLWPQSLGHLCLDTTSGEPIRKEILLRRVKFDCAKQAQVVERIYWHNPHPTAHSVEDAVTKLPSTRQRFARLAIMTAGRLWVDPTGRTTTHFQWCTELARLCQFSPAPAEYFDW